MLHPGHIPIFSHSLTSFLYFSYGGPRRCNAWGFLFLQDNSCRNSCQRGLFSRNINRVIQKRNTVIVQIAKNYTELRKRIDILHRESYNIHRVKAHENKIKFSEAPRQGAKENTMEKKVTITLTEREARYIQLVAIALKYNAIREARKTTDDDLRESRERTAEMWAEIHDKIKAQRQAQETE